MSMPLNVIGTELEPCALDPVTGFYRDGNCVTGPEDFGLHIVCVRVTGAFLTFSQQRGNDLQTPRPEFGFPGLSPGDRWCLCVERWREALVAGVAPPVHLNATHISALEFVDLADLKRHSVRADEARG